MRTAGLVAAVLLLVLAAPVAGAASHGFAAQTGDVDPDTVVLAADVAEDGSATWRVEYRVRLDDENTTAAFEDLQADIQDNRSRYVDRFERRMQATVADAENATGREMSVEDVSIEASIEQLPQEYGVVTYTFTWTSFAAVDGNQLTVGDALSGFYLDEETSLVISWPDGYETRLVSPEPDERGDSSVTWTGPRTFARDEPRVVVAPESALPVSLPLLGLAALVVLLGGGLVWYTQRGDRDEAPPAAGTAADQGAGSGGGAAAGTAAGGGAAAGVDDEPPSELLSPQERVLKLVRQRGGRMKQTEITDELDWSAARTSQVVGDLREDGDLETFRLGRENVVRLPEDDDDLS